MKLKALCTLVFSLLLYGCDNRYYSEKGYPSLLKIDSHVHINSDKGYFEEVAQQLDKFPNKAVDMSARICHLQYQSARDRKRIRDFCIKYQDRLLYGTDSGDNGDTNPERFKKEMHETWL